jgi:hypothetical protein
MSGITESYITILNLIHRYPELVDAGDFAGVGELFRNGTLVFEDAAGNTVAELTGSAAVAASYSGVRLHSDGTPRTRHVISNPIVDIDPSGESATCRYYVTVFQQAEGFPLQPVWANRYEDRLQRVGGEWRISRRRGFAHLIGDTSQHLVAAPDLGNRSA